MDLWTCPDSCREGKRPGVVVLDLTIVEKKQVPSKKY
jgi:hypothetical protein